MKNLSVFSENQVATFKAVASEVKVKTENRTAEKWVDELLNSLQKADRKTLSKQQIAVLNTLNEHEHAVNRDLRIQAITPDKPGICEVIKIEACKSTEKSPLNVDTVAKQLSKQFNRDIKKMKQRVKSQCSYYLRKEHGILMSKIDASNYYCENPNFAKTKLK
jgi:hypothetical protein